MYFYAQMLLMTNSKLRSHFPYTGQIPYYDLPVARILTMSHSIQLNIDPLLRTLYLGYVHCVG